ncbi:hypothetical protein QO003_001580 [Arthrobacter silviterrae]|uniref:Uncharacterized protein n=1 Tax=Arthrobacter silviterrae TaxID=2026658 RepID=A0ABX0D7M1_9MICC|nr:MULTISPECIES: hypothetical protein [Arthrobacter]MCU6479372.1 hypothetical protein [Arthrobacter sp. A2-55]MDQ0277277.1 hypothetical protein [Arthrobacter silviterrae]NGN82888.1 hypothetical protein [Arthrobacter silviterrae]
MATESPGDDALVATVGHLIKALRALGLSGDPDAANRIAARAWLALRDGQPRQAERLNGAMHYLVRLPQGPGTDSTSPPTKQEER